LIGPEARGDPELALRWTAKSLHTVARGVREMGHEISARSVAPLLHELGYSLQSARKAKEGKQHPDRDAQFCHINKRVSAAITAGEPAISIDTKKKELVGEFKNAGQEWRPAGEPVEVLTHDFPSDAAGKAIAFGVYDIAQDTGLVNVGVDRETAELAVNSIRAWWDQLGSARYPEAKTLQITVDCGGGNGNRTKLWKTELQELATQTGLAISVCHFQPGTSKWNQIEHRLRSFISKLARRAANLLRGDHQSDRSDDHHERARGLRPPRPTQLPQGRGLRCAAVRGQAHRRQVPPRVELHDQAPGSNRTGAIIPARSLT
jgi:hypothetical protein